MGHLCLQWQKVWNLEEITNSMLVLIRQLPVLDLLVGIWNHQMEVFYTHAVQHQHLETFLAPVAHKKYGTNLEAGRRHRVTSTSSAFGMDFVTGCRDGVRVTLPGQPSNFGCACKSYQCIDPITFVSVVYTKNVVISAFNIPY